MAREKDEERVLGLDIPTKVEMKNGKKRVEMRDRQGYICSDPSSLKLPSDSEAAWDQALQESLRRSRSREGRH